MWIADTVVNVLLCLERSVRAGLFKLLFFVSRINQIQPFSGISKYEFTKASVP